MCLCHCVEQVAHAAFVVGIEPRIASQMAIGKLCYFASARGALDEAFLDEERLIHFFHGACIFAYGGGNGAQSDGTALELVDDGGQYLVVYLVKPEAVDVERFE